MIKGLDHGWIRDAQSLQRAEVGDDRRAVPLEVLHLSVKEVAT